MVGTSFVLLSTYLYNLPDRHHIPGHRPPPIRIVSFEKPAISPAMTPRVVATPRAVEPNRLALDPFLSAGADEGLTSSRPATPMLPRIPSRGDFSKRED